MAILSSSNNLMLSLKILLISTSVLSLAITLKLFVPVVVEFVFSAGPIFYNIALLLLKPPYLYILVNGIIISILASSKLHQKVDYDSPPPETVIPAVVPPAAVKISEDGAILNAYDYDASVEPKVSINAQVLETAEVYGRREAKVSERNVGDEMDGGDEAVVLRSVRMPHRNDSMEFFVSNEKEKPLVSARFGHRKAVKPSSEGGKVLGVSKPKRQDTLESTWKTITEGRAMPLTRHLKKSDTWDSHAQSSQPKDENTPPKVKKYETFHDRTSTKSRLSGSGGSGKLRKEPSLSQDELNRRVEAFIDKFNEEMRLQRQESLHQYQEMIRRGAH